MITTKKIVATAVSDNKLAWLIAEYERAGCAIFEDHIYPCDVGAIILAELCDRAEIPREVVTGLYWHASLREYARAVGENYRQLKKALRAGIDPSAPQAELHTWTVARPTGAKPMLLDPNGELRGEPRAQPLDTSADRYEPLDESDPAVELQRNIRAAYSGAP